MAKKIYILSGLGADERVFQRLDFSGFSAIFIKWIDPLENETIENYATRICEQIPTRKPTLIGLSFGGLMAVEIAKQIDTEKVILIASAKTKWEIPFYYRLVGRLRLHKLLPIQLLKGSNFITDWFFGLSSDFDRKLLKQILIDTNPNFLRWAIGQIVCWVNEVKPERVFHIHGTNDRILPVRFVDCNYRIKNGGHLMTLNRSEALNQILQQHL